MAAPDGLAAPDGGAVADGGAAGRALVAGWFSFDEVVATVGDQAGLDVTVRWLREAGWAVDVALAPYLGRGLDWRRVDPARYDLFVFTTGPLRRDPRLTALLDRFAGTRRWALNVSVLASEVAARFDRVFARDGDGSGWPDLAWAGPPPAGPYVGVAYAPVQTEYAGGRHEEMAETIGRWVEDRRLAAVELDMDLYAHHRFPRTPAQTQTAIGRCDVVVSMRLHATVLALRHGVPVIACDPVEGGGKVTAQAAAAGWPCLLQPDRIGERALDDALAFCLTDRAREAAAAARRRALAALDELRAELTRALAG